VTSVLSYEYDLFGGNYIWVYGYMGIWIYGCMGIWVYGYMGIWVYGYMGVIDGDVGWKPGQTTFSHHHRPPSVPVLTASLES